MTPTQGEVSLMANDGTSMIKLPDADEMLNTGNTSLSATNDYNYLVAFFKVNASAFKFFVAAHTPASSSPLVKSAVHQDGPSGVEDENGNGDVGVSGPVSKPKPDTVHPKPNSKSSLVLSNLPASASHTSSTLSTTSPFTNQRINDRVAGDVTHEFFVTSNMLGGLSIGQGGLLIAAKASYPGWWLWHPLLGYPTIEYGLGLGGTGLQPGRVLSQTILFPRTFVGLTLIPAAFGGTKMIVCYGHSTFRSHGSGGSDATNESGSSL